MIFPKDPPGVGTLLAGLYEDWLEHRVRTTGEKRAEAVLRRVKTPWHRRKPTTRKENRNNEKLHALFMEWITDLGRRGFHAGQIRSFLRDGVPLPAGDPFPVPASPVPWPEDEDEGPRVQTPEELSEWGDWGMKPAHLWDDPDDDLLDGGLSPVYWGFGDETPYPADPAARVVAAEVRERAGVNPDGEIRELRIGRSFLRLKFQVWVDPRDGEEFGYWHDLVFSGIDLLIPRTREVLVRARKLLGLPDRIRSFRERCALGRFACREEAVSGGYCRHHAYLAPEPEENIPVSDAA